LDSLDNQRLFVDKYYRLYGGRDRKHMVACSLDLRVLSYLDDGGSYAGSKERRCQMRFRIVDIHEEDAYRIDGESSRKRITGRIIKGDKLKVWTKENQKVAAESINGRYLVGPVGWWFGPFEIEGGPAPYIEKGGYFFAAKLEYY